MKKRIITSFKAFENKDENVYNQIINITDTVDTDLLASLSDERDTVKEGDIVLATYFNAGFTTYEFEVEYSDIDDEDELMNLGNSDGEVYYDLSNAYHVVKKSTYENSK